MPITDVITDPETLTLTIIGDYPVPVERLWNAWSDPRQLERFWGPPTWPATFTRHDMVEGGRSEYFMTGPDGTMSAGYWVFENIDEGRTITVVDGFADEDGNPNEDMPTNRSEFRFETTETGSRYVAVSTFTDADAMQELLDMGMLEGATAAVAQIDDVLADLAAFAAGQGIETEVLDDTRVMFRRVIRGSVEQVWNAHHDAEQMRRWMLGPDGWTMPVCEVATNVGDTYRYEWEADDGSGSFGFEGQMLESVPPLRAVTTEAMIGMEGPSTTNVMTLTPVPDGTLLSLVITYPSQELRDTILATGMSDGMETSYERLDELLGASV